VLDYFKLLKALFSFAGLKDTGLALVVGVGKFVCFLSLVFFVLGPFIVLVDNMEGPAHRAIPLWLDIILTVPIITLTFFVLGDGLDRFNKRIRIWK
jgi:hypothetical protein